MKTLLFLFAAAACAPVIAATPTPTPQIVYVASPTTFSMWNAKTTIRAGRYMQGTIPDTFTFHLTLTATTPVRARIMSLEEFVKFVAGEATKSIDYGVLTNFDVTFHEAEGCADYVFILDATEDSTITPNVTIDRNPSRSPTGVCAP